MALMMKNGALLAHYFGGRLALTEDEDVCDCVCGDGGDVVTTCGCDNMPATLYLYAADDTFLTELHYVNPMTVLAAPVGLDGWEMDYDGGVVEFFCFGIEDGEADDRWYLNDQEGGVVNVLVSGCTGVLASFTGTVMGDVYVSTTPP